MKWNWNTIESLLFLGLLAIASRISDNWRIPVLLATANILGYLRGGLVK